MSNRSGVGATGKREESSLASIVEQYLADLATRATAKSIHAARVSLARLGRELRGLTVTDVRAWRVERLAGGVSNKTVNQDIVYLQAALNCAVNAGLLELNPLAALRALPTTARHQRRRARVLSDDEVRRLIQVAIEADRPGSFPRAPFVAMLALSGARYGEASRVTWSDFDRVTGTLTFRGETTKTEHERTIPLDAELVGMIDALRWYHAKINGAPPGPSACIFLGPRGHPWNRDSGPFLIQLKALYRKAGIELRDGLGRVVHCHAMRHSHATRLARAGVPVAVAMQLTGHRSPSVLLQIYTRLASEDARSAVEGLPRLL